MVYTLHEKVNRNNNQKGKRKKKNYSASRSGLFVLVTMVSEQAKGTLRKDFYLNGKLTQRAEKASRERLHQFDFLI